MKTCRIFFATMKILTGVIVALAQTASFAQTATGTSSVGLAPASTIAPSHSHGMAPSAAPAAAQTQPKAHKDRPHMHVKNWMKQPNGLVGVAPLDPSTVPKFVNQLTKPAVYVPIGTQFDATIGVNVPLYEVTESIIFQQILPPGFPKTKVYAYGGLAKVDAPGQDPPGGRGRGGFGRHEGDSSDFAHDRGGFGRDPNDPNTQTVFSTPGPTFEATANQRIFVHYINNLTEPHMFPVDPTIMAANPNNSPTPPAPFAPFPPGYPQFQFPIVTVPHLHGGVTPSDFDGFPKSWFSAGLTRVGETFDGTTFEYFNGQLPTTLWYHDHALGMTRLNLAAGLEGTYIIRDADNDTVAPLLPSGRFEMPLMLADKAFNTDGSIHFTTVGDNPDVHPYWDPEYFGDTILVNGQAWPNMNVDRAQYRFRIVNGSNARFYNISLSNGMSFTQVGADGSYLPAPVTLTSLLLAVCERGDILIDFSNLAPGTKVVLMNSANAPFPGGDPPDANTSVIMQFTVMDTPPVHPNPLPSTLITVPALVPTDDANPKLFTLNEQEHPVTGDPIAVLIDGRHFDEDITELPRAGTTEEWYIQNLTDDAHPIHIHLVEFQLEDRQNIDVDRFKAYWESLNGADLPLNHPPIRVNAETAVDTGDGTGSRDFLIGDPIEPSPSESGWKDVFLAPHGMITRLLIRMAPQAVQESDLSPGKNTFPFDPTAGPGYVWHCHILDHEDSDMMRPMQIVSVDLPCLNCAAALPKSTPGTSTAAGNSAPGTGKPAHSHYRSTSAREQQMKKGPMPAMPMPSSEEGLPKSTPGTSTAVGNSAPGTGKLDQ
ncbi:MAG TPA: multicopper oxidase domain-containing protein [Terriglobales bacterium]|nr:multicopper oxidase domain-containing protein [Terriglobales bacterium]